MTCTTQPTAELVHDMIDEIETLWAQVETLPDLRRINAVSGNESPLPTRHDSFRPAYELPVPEIKPLVDDWQDNPPDGLPRGALITAVLQELWNQRLPIGDWKQVELLTEIPESLTVTRILTPRIIMDVIEREHIAHRLAMELYLQVQSIVNEMRQCKVAAAKSLANAGLVDPYEGMQLHLPLQIHLKFEAFMIELFVYVDLAGELRGANSPEAAA